MLVVLYFILCATGVLAWIIPCFSRTHAGLRRTSTPSNQPRWLEWCTTYLANHKQCLSSTQVSGLNSQATVVRSSILLFIKPPYVSEVWSSKKGGMVSCDSSQPHWFNFCTGNRWDNHVAGTTSRTEMLYEKQDFGNIWWKERGVPVSTPLINMIFSTSWILLKLQ